MIDYCQKEEGNLQIKYGGQIFFHKYYNTFLRDFQNSVPSSIN